MQSVINKWPMNSFPQHIDTPAVRRILPKLIRLVTTGRHVHVLQLFLPESASITQFLASSDREKFLRPLGEWKQIFSDAFEPVVLEPYDVGMFGIPLWKMVYFKGRAR